MIGFLVLFLAAAALLAAIGTCFIVHQLTHPPRQTYAVALARQMPLSPGEIGMEFTEDELRLSDGRTTPAWIIKGQHEDGPTVVITHGWGDSRYGALGWAVPLAAFAAELVVYDLRGMGECKTPASHLGTTEIDDLVGIVAELHRDKPIVLFGASIGGGISIGAAARAAQQGRSEIVGVIGDGAYRRGMEPILGFFRLQRWPVMLFYPFIGLWLVLRYATPTQFDRARHAAGLRCPLLLLHGTDDPICPLASAREIAAAAPNGRIVEFPGGGHLDAAAADPERYNSALAEFFGSLESPKESI
ncbi:MAG: alpha/beta fold hydrolase [Planctomycetes bacterium]|nr:alpha/beta fold hydrolase [Planctomycetota bacterium]